MMCDVCSKTTKELHVVLGVDTPLCTEHQAAWTELGPMATMIAYTLKRFEQRAKLHGERA